MLFSFLQISLVQAQDDYTQTAKNYRSAYIKNHEVVTGADTANFNFFPISEKWNIPVSFTKIDDAPWFAIATSKGVTKNFRKYGSIRFEINDTICTLYLYQSEQLINKPEFVNYLFLPFMDKTTGISTYETGRYLELDKSYFDQNHILYIDFNKTFNPYCAYGLGAYNCPIAPQENKVPVAITAGEKKFKTPKQKL